MTEPIESDVDEPEDSKLMYRIGMVLRRRKEKVGLTYVDLTVLTGLSNSTMIRVFNFKGTSVSNLAKIVVAVGMTQTEFWARVEQQPVSTGNMLDKIEIASRRLKDALDFVDEARMELES